MSSLLVLPFIWSSSCLTVASSTTQNLRQDWPPGLPGACLHVPPWSKLWEGRDFVEKGQKLFLKQPVSGWGFCLKTWGLTYSMPGLPLPYVVDDFKEMAPVFHHSLNPQPLWSYLIAHPIERRMGLFPDPLKLVWTCDLLWLMRGGRSC